MNSRFLRWMVLGFTCLWFGMLVPVHQRGQIQLPGLPAVASGGCCQKDAKPACHGGKPSKQEGQKKPARDTGNCAVCHFIAGLDAPPPVTIYVARLGLVLDQPADDVIVAPLRHAGLPFHGLDPPTA